MRRGSLRVRAGALVGAATGAVLGALVLSAPAVANNPTGFDVLLSATQGMGTDPITATERTFPIGGLSAAHCYTSVDFYWDGQQIGSAPMTMTKPDATGQQYCVGTLRFTPPAGHRALGSHDVTGFPRPDGRDSTTQYTILDHPAPTPSGTAGSHPSASPTKTPGPTKTQSATPSHSAGAATATPSGTPAASTSQPGTPGASVAPGATTTLAAVEPPADGHPLVAVSVGTLGSVCAGALGFLVYRRRRGARA